MKTLTVRYSFREWSLVVLIGSVLGTMMWTMVHNELPTQAWSDPFFWLVIVPVMLAIMALIRLIPVARFTEDSIKAYSYPFKIRWVDVRKVAVSPLFGNLRLKIYGAGSRFPITVPLPVSKLHQMLGYFERHVKSEVTFSALNDARLNKMLQRSASLPLGSR